MKNRSLSIHKVILCSSVFSITITGISFFDSKIWNLIMIFFSMITYSIVGILYYFRLILSKKEGKQAYKSVFLILLIIGYFVYQGIIKFQRWVLSWSLLVKILVISFTVILIIITIILIVRNNKRRQ